MRSALESVLGQQADGVRFEVIVVDNNSTDETKQVVDSFVRRGHSNLRYVFEGRQGLSYARNAAIAVAGSPLVAFTDDDIRVAPDWVSTIKRVFDEHPEAAWVGGKVLPCWPSAPPRWLTGDDWGPLALADHGDLPFYTSDRRQTCLVGANLAVRRDVLAQCGGFAPRLQRVKDSIGSMEDHELQMRLWRANRKGLYVPELVVFSDVAADRLLKKYYRRWHFGHGRFYALARLEEFECSNVGWLFGVSAHALPAGDRRCGRMAGLRDPRQLPSCVHVREEPLVFSRILERPLQRVPGTRSCHTRRRAQPIRLGADPPALPQTDGWARPYKAEWHVIWDVNDQSWRDLCR